jgi:putative sporulation protein YtxC
VKGVISLILLSIGYSKKNRDIYDKLKELCKFFKDKEINIAMAESDVGNMHYVKCILKDTENDIKLFDDCRELFYSYSSNAIYDFISTEYITELLEKLLRENYSYLSYNDLGEIKQRCIEVVAGSGIFSTQGLLYSINCKNNIIKKIDEYLQESIEIILDGFITFRLKDLNEELTNLVEKIIEEYVIEKEYSEFIKLLKYFVDIQESRYDVINIIINSSGDYVIEDENLNNITEDFFADFNIDNIKGEVNKHDILVSALITCAPNKIVVHGMINIQNQEVMDTIKNIFLDKLSFCPGCEICQGISTLTKV